jgi:hypothetical protein
MAKDLQKKYESEYNQRLQESKSMLEAERNKLLAEQQSFEEKKKNENQLFMQKIQQERQKIETEVQEQMRRSIAADFENKLKMLEQNKADTEEKLKLSRQKELEFLQKEQQLKNKEEELELSLQKKLQEARASLAEEIRQQEHQKNDLKETAYQMKLQEMQKQLEDQKKLAEEMRRKAEQGSMQMQGEVQELLLEKMLRESFPFDAVEEVGKGVEGADCIQVVRNHTGKECGRIIYESKRTKGWNNNWVDKLKSDMRNRGADVAILVTQTFPRDMERFGEKDGVWICNFQEVISIAALMRSGIMNMYEIQKSQENKGDKMQMLYDYMTGVEFRGQIASIAEGFKSLRDNITRERMQMEKIWKEREKVLEKVLLSTSGLYGSVKGIAGASLGDVPLLDGDSPIDEIGY